MIHTIPNSVLSTLATGMALPEASAGALLASVPVVRQMVEAAGAFVTSLGPEQRSKARFAFGDRERFNWHYIPRSRQGLPLKEMNGEQRRRARLLLEAGLSDQGYWKATTIMALEAVLHEIESGERHERDPQNYAFTIFGHPSATGTWGWRAEGHHLSLNITVVEGRLLAEAPRFLGANPAEVLHGDLAGTRVLQKEEDLARALVRALADRQRDRAVFREQPYRDIVTGNSPRVDPLKPEGISAADLTALQRAGLQELIDVYAAAMPDDIARQRMARVEKAAPGDLHFGWAGSLNPGEPHYYRILGPDFLIEYDNVQNEATHIHTVWRDFQGDFGRDLLREHYRDAHGDGS
ncbi:MAG TPA: DUF3500 domain-containing protein [Desulfosarcina sp.]|nr:DUF3500 domain-containing protein [Desulfosarcina sp.]